MTECSELADYEWLTGPEAAALATKLAACDGPLHRRADQLRKRVSPERSRLVVELTDLRSRGEAKFSAAGRMFFTRIALEQATDEWVAAYKATRFAGRERVADFCCGIGGDLIQMARHASVIGVDRDPIAAYFARANARAVLPPREFERVVVRPMSVEKFVRDEMCSDDAWHIDPDRRPAGHRTTSPEWSSPDRMTIEQMIAAAPHAAIKLAPGAKVPAEWAARCELEWISRGGDCRQLVAWHGGLANATGSRRATVVSPSADGITSHSFVGEPNRPTRILKVPARYVFDCDPSLYAARLLGSFAEAHGLSALSTGPTYLAGDEPVDDELLSCFETREVLPLRAATIAAVLRERGVGLLEIKKRGVELTPEQLRKSLKLGGEHPAVLLITNISGKPAAILARRRESRRSKASR